MKFLIFLLLLSFNAEANITITLPTDSVILEGSGSDSDGVIIAYKWEQVSGSACVITSPNSANTSVKFTTAGIYIFRLTVMDNDSATATDDVQVTVNPPIDTRSITLTGTASGKTHTLNWAVNGSPNSFQVRSNVLIATLPGTSRTYSTTTNKKGGNITYTVTAVWSDRSITSNSVTLKIGR
jgi:hypothetical protein